jgi:hypothetical protein
LIQPTHPLSGNHRKGDVVGSYFQENQILCLSGYTPLYMDAWHVTEYPRRVSILA